MATTMTESSPESGSSADGPDVYAAGVTGSRPVAQGAPVGVEPGPDATYDVVVIGGSLAGSSSALLLRQRLPEARILIVEPAERIGRKVGEATVETSGLFLHRVLGQYDHLSRCQLPKHGLRFWFHDRRDATLRDMTEIGPRGLPSAPSFQLDRSILDQHLLETAAQRGVELWRPAKATEIEQGWPASRVTIEHHGRATSVQCRWVIDASGRHGFVARRKRLFERVEEHPTAACWGRWTGCRDLDSAELMGDVRAPRHRPLIAARRLATNHFCGYGYWIWVIPLAGGETSVGVVWDKELFELPGEGSKRERFECFLRQEPGVRELLEGASLCGDDFLSLSHLPYRTKQYAGRGWALVGDAAGFIDPYYSPGIDHLATSVWATVDIVAAELTGHLDEATLDRRLSEHNTTFVGGFRRWLDALYIGKYKLMGDAELTSCAFLLDTAFYYFGVVTGVYRNVGALSNGVFGGPPRAARIAYWVARFFNRRLQWHAELRRRRGTYGRRNAGWKLYIAPFRLGKGGVLSIGRGLRHWLRIELSALFAWRRVRPSEAVEADVHALRTASSSTD